MNKKYILLIALFFILVITSFFIHSKASALGVITGRVVDSITLKPISGAIIRVNDVITETDRDGIFKVKTSGQKVYVKAYGYLKTEEPIIAKPLLFSPFVSNSMLIKLTPFKPKALYLSFYGIGSQVLRNSAIKLIEETELNSLVIDVKGDKGMIPYPSSIALASEIGAQKIITVKDMKGLLKSLKDRGIYTIARIVVFKDNLLAQAKPELAIKSRDGTIWKDRENLSWVDASKKEVWDYNINIAEEAARLGFDEIQFDYVRFPDSKGIVFSIENTEENRVKAISGFLAEAKKRLIPYDVFVAADIFGYVSWNQNDTQIGQKLENLTNILDYFSPMLYPSGFQFGIPGYRIPVAHPHEIVYLSLKRSQERTKLEPIRFRPWIQAFRDYAFDRRYFTGKEIREQIDAAEKFGSHGWMLWNPRNQYSSEGLKKINS
ncbi:MAG: GTP-binding protein [Nitrospirae bacterium]|jgi:hypothetical protein|nr:GTP-binding protein [Nitrospirota bacterium]